MFFFFSSRRRHTRWPRDWSSDVCSSDLCVRTAEEQDKELWDLSDQELAEISEHLDDSVRSVLSVEGSIGSRDAKGGTAPARVAEQGDAVAEQITQLRAFTRGR